MVLEININQLKKKKKTTKEKATSLITGSLATVHVGASPLFKIKQLNSGRVLLQTCLEGVITGGARGALQQTSGPSEPFH